MKKKLSKLVLIVVLIVILGGVSGIWADRFLLPWLSSKESLKRFKFLQKANERVTVINRTEQVTVKEDFSVTKTAQNVLPTVVSIVSYADNQDQTAALGNIKTSQDIQNYVKTGIILTGDGLIMSVLTVEKNENLQEQRLKYKVMAADGREFDAQIKAIDPFSNLVFYKANVSNLPAPTFGDSDQLESGEKIIVAGNSAGEYQNNFSLGIIKEKDRTFSLLNSELSSSELMEGAIITDAEIDAKNIGGPVIDFNGTVVGIANQMEKDGKKVGFVVPINSLKDSINKVIGSGEFKRPELGVYYLSINREIALLNNLSSNEGALVYSFSGQQGLAVIKNSAADLAGIKLGDIIIAVNGEKVDLSHSLSSLVAKYQPGDEITLKYFRAGKEAEIKVKLN